jgi:FkbM family methyltransferase
MPGLSRIMRAQAIYPLMKWIHLQFVARFRSPIAYRRGVFQGQLRRLARSIASGNMAGVLIAPDGEAFIRTYDGFLLHYNCTNFQRTIGDGQSLEWLSGQSGGPVEQFVIGCLANDSVYFDVGANNGYFYTVKSARRFPACRVYAFEPDPRILWHLRRNIEFNGIANVTIVPKALSDRATKATLTENLGASGYLLTTAGASGVDVECTTLDLFVKEMDVSRVDLIKVDIEGGEFNFLKGAVGTLERYSPILVVELRDALLKRSGSSVSEVVRFLNQLRYKVYSVDGTPDAVCIPFSKINLVPALATIQHSEIAAASTAMDPNR